MTTRAKTVSWHQKGPFEAKMGPFGMALSRPKMVPGWCPRGYSLTVAPGERHGPLPPTPPPHPLDPPLHQRQQNRNNSPFSARRSHSALCSRSCKPQASKMHKSVGSPGTLPTNPPPHGAHTSLGCTSSRTCLPLGEFLPQWACIWPMHQHCCAFLGPMSRPFNRLISMSPLGILSLRSCEECG